MLVTGLQKCTILQFKRNEKDEVRQTSAKMLNQYVTTARPAVPVTIETEYETLFFLEKRLILL